MYKMKKSFYIYLSLTNLLIIITIIFIIAFIVYTVFYDSSEITNSVILLIISGILLITTGVLIYETVKKGIKMKKYKKLQYDIKY